jgi:hypothetical protein
MAVELNDFFDALNGALEAAREQEIESELSFDLEDERQAEIHCTLTKANVVEVVCALINKAHNNGRMDEIREQVVRLESKRMTMMDQEV